ncbi:MAG: hypothetical protein ACOYOS_19520 [Syntrophales bacterium]
MSRIIYAKIAFLLIYSGRELHCGTRIQGHHQRRDYAYLVPKKSVFNRIIGDSQLELRFAGFLEDCSDVASFAKNYLAVHFKLDYVNAGGDISNYYPDFIVKLSGKRIVIVETKGQEDLDVPLKMARLSQWCEDINRVQKEVAYDFVYVDEESFEKYKPTSFRNCWRPLRNTKRKSNADDHPGNSGD